MITYMGTSRRPGLGAITPRNLDCAMAQFSATDPPVCGEYAAWGGQCSPELWGFDTCAVAQELSGRVKSGGDISLLAQYIRFGDFASHVNGWSPEQLARAQQLYANFMAGGSIVSQAPRAVVETAAQVVPVVPAVPTPVVVVPSEPVQHPSPLSPLAYDEWPTEAPAGPASGYVETASQLATQPIAGIPAWAWGLGLVGLVLAFKGGLR